MALSTSIPIAIIKAPNEIRCNVVPHISRIGKEPAIVNTRPAPIINPLRRPIVKMRAMITIRTDSTKLTMKELIASSTLSGWKKIFSISIPAGTLGMISFSLASTAFPTSGTIASFSIEIQIASACSPSTKKPFSCGSL